MEGVQSDVEFHGGDGNDVFIHNGSGTAWLDGGAGQDYMVAGPQTGSAGSPFRTISHDGGQWSAVLLGGAGRDYLVQQAPRGVYIDGGGDEDVIHGGAGNDKIRGGSGGDEIFGNGGLGDIAGQSGHDLIRL